MIKSIGTGIAAASTKPIPATPQKPSGFRIPSSRILKKLLHFFLKYKIWLLGILKPDPRAFGRAAGELGLAADQIVFLDDMPANVEGARQAGLIAVRVPWDDPGPAIDTARELLGLPARGR